MQKINLAEFRKLDNNGKDDKEEKDMQEIIITIAHKLR